MAVGHCVGRAHRGKYAPGVTTADCVSSPPLPSSPPPPLPSPPPPLPSPLPPPLSPPLPSCLPYSQAGSYVRDDLVAGIVRLISSTPELQGCAAQLLYRAVLKDDKQQSLVQVSDN